MQATSDPVFHEIMIEAALVPIPLRMLLVGLNQSLPDLPADADVAAADQDDRVAEPGLLDPTQSRVTGRGC